MPAKGKANSSMAKQGSRMLSSLPHFFQPLLPGFHDHFSIPVGFGKYLEGREVGEGNIAVLRSPGGKIYRVEMENGREFKDGWKEFVDEHDLHVGDVVVFRLVDDPMVFDVMIFDPSACERPYPHNEVDVKTEEVVAAAEEERPLPCAAAGVAEPETGLHSIENGSGTPMETIRIAKDGPSEAKKPYFVVSIKPDNLNNRRQRIPKCFSMTYGLNLGNAEGVVLDEEGRSWPVRINCYWKSSCDTYIERGWGAFQKENELKLGDTFNLELVQGGQKPVLRMSGLHANPMLEKAYSEKVRKERRKRVEVKKYPIHIQDSPAAGFSEMADTHFMLTVTNHFLGVYPSIPNKLARYGGLHGGSRSLILTNEKGRDWLVTVETSTDDVTYIANGWTELVRENGLGVGDTVRVDLVERGMNPAMSFKVVSRNTNAKQRETSSDK
ncbi:unnamed protein product [Linum trigynum]|uniref:TF-B3 domain-containing protein n=1 Tax=Linum trigynum TaxID=586398 RepID=A0AAV2EGY9_9ROSI